MTKMLSTDAVCWIRNVWIFRTDVTLLKINDLGIGTENMFISPRMSFQDGRVSAENFFAKVVVF